MRNNRKFGFWGYRKRCYLELVLKRSDNIKVSIFRFLKTLFLSSFTQEVVKMEIKIKYTVSDRKHSMILNEFELNTMLESGSMEITQPTPKGSKSFTIIGTDSEKRLLADAILNSIK